MSKSINLFIFLCFFLCFKYVSSQEWKSLKSYQKETGKSKLSDGCWLKSDRKKQTLIWKNANMFNLLVKNGNLKYVTISEKRDFYIWFDQERDKIGHDIRWIGIASIATGQLSKLDNSFIKIFIVRNKEVIQFSNEGSKKVFAFAFLKLKQVILSKEVLKGGVAKKWDQNYGLTEQCDILNPLYQNLSKKALQKLDRMAKGRGLFTFGVPKKIKFIGDINNCETRYNHGINKLLAYYLELQKVKL